MTAAPHATGAPRRAGGLHDPVASAGRGLVTAFRHGGLPPSLARLVDELERTVAEMERLAG